jgi:hypothetical protein
MGGALFVRPERNSIAGAGLASDVGYKIVITHGECTLLPGASGRAAGGMGQPVAAVTDER